MNKLKKQKKAAVFCSRGLGDGLLFMLISNNLQKNGYEVVTYHEFLGQMQGWFEGFFIKKFPEEKMIFSLLEDCDLIVINGDGTLKNQLIQKCAKTYFSEKTYLLRPSTCKAKNFAGDFRFNPQKSMVCNLMAFCEKSLCLSPITPLNGLQVKAFQKKYKKYPNRIIIHPTSSDIRRNWPTKKFISLAKRLKKNNKDPVFLLSEEERKDNKEILSAGFTVPILGSLDDVASYIYESGYLLGNDSGLGHLASCLSIPTLTIFASRRKKDFWVPGWFCNQKVGPKNILPNIKYCRLSEKYWDKTISVSRVYKNFCLLEKKVKNEESCHS